MRYFYESTTLYLVFTVFLVDWFTGSTVSSDLTYSKKSDVLRKYSSCPQLQGSGENFSMHVSIYECESTGGSEWVLEQTLHLDDFTRPSSTLDPRVSVDSNLFVYSRSGGHCLCVCIIFCQPLYVYQVWASHKLIHFSTPGLTCT